MKGIRHGHGWLAAVLAVCLCAGIGVAHADVAVPKLTARVTDLTGTLTPQQTQQLESQLAALEQRKGAQVVVLMLPTTQPDDIADYATRVFDQWKIGRKGVDDGVLVVVAKGDHRAMIETGYGLEGAIPDAAAARIIREYLSPKFRVGDFNGGLNDAIGALAKLIDGEPLPPPLQGPQRNRGGGIVHGQDWFTGLLVAGFALMWARGFFRWVPRTPRAGLVGAAAGGLSWLFSGLWLFGVVFGVLGLLVGFAGGAGGSYARRGGSGGWGGGPGGWGGFGGGGFGGGGFGGGGGFSGGGGSTGGGGASGSW